MEAEGDLLVFCDDRLVVKQGSIGKFVRAAETNAWMWGIKDNNRKGFVENFSAVFRKELISRGMFNERINVYGGTTQDIRTRFEKIGGFFLKPVNAHATAVAKSGSKWRRKKDIIKAKLQLFKLYG